MKLFLIHAHRLDTIRNFFHRFLKFRVLQQHLFIWIAPLFSVPNFEKYSLHTHTHAHKKKYIYICNIPKYIYVLCICKSPQYPILRKLNLLNQFLLLFTLIKFGLMFSALLSLSGLFCVVVYSSNSKGILNRQLYLIDGGQLFSCCCQCPLIPCFVL